MAIQHTTAERNGDRYDTRTSWVFEVRDGKVCEVQLYESDPEAEDRFWS